MREYAHAVLHVGVDAESERAKREAEAEVVGYVVGRPFGLDTNGSAFYLATWQDNDAEIVEDRFNRISQSLGMITKVMIGNHTSR